jgi:hypothetical protein
MVDRTTSILTSPDTTLFFSDTFSDTLISLSVGNTGRIFTRPVDVDPTTGRRVGEFHLSVGRLVGGQATHGLERDGAAAVVGRAVA